MQPISLTWEPVIRDRVGRWCTITKADVFHYDKHGHWRSLCFEIEQQGKQHIAVWCIDGGSLETKCKHPDIDKVKAQCVDLANQWLNKLKGN